MQRLNSVKRYVPNCGDNQKKLILNATKNLILILTVLFLLWILVSWIDIVAHNDPWRGSHEYMPGNAFSVLVHEYD